MAASSPPPVRIGEVAWAGSSLSIADEWLELWNVSPDPIPLNGWRLSGASDTTIIFGSQEVIAPYSAYLIANYDSTNTKSVLNVHPNLVTTNVAISNSALNITLRDPNDLLIDQLDTQGHVPSAGSSTPKASMIRQGNAWVSATSTQNIKTGSPDLGTPGLCDDCSVMVAIASVNPDPVPDPIPTPIDPPPEPTIETPSNSSPPPNVEDPVPTPVEATPSATPVDQIDPVPESTTSSAISSDQTITDETTSTIEIIPPVTIESAESSSTVELPVATITVDQVEQPAVSSAVMQTTSQTKQTASTTTNTVTTITLQPRIHRAMSNPTSGSEWIELGGVTSSTIPYLLNAWIEDAVGPIFRFTPDNLLQVSMIENDVHINLSKTYLNNDGDMIKIKSPTGELLDQITLPALKKDVIWDRDAVVTSTPISPQITTSIVDSEGSTDIPTPAPTIQFIPTPPSESMETTSSTPTIATAPTTKVAISSNNSKPTAKKTTKTKAETRTATSTGSVAKPKTTKTKTVTVKKTTTKTTKSSPITSTTFDMLPDIQPQTRVRLSGTVASLPTQVGSGYFVIQNEDGRGLLIHNNQYQPIPSFGLQITLTGLLTLSETGASLKMQKDDRWLSQGTSTHIVTPRSVDLLAPSQEDAWSFVDVTATVLDVRGQTIYLDVDGIDIQAKIKTMVQYRPSRLNPGDTIRIRGLLDSRGGTPIILPRNPDEIVVLKAAAAHLSSGQAPQDQWPAWTPFGAAGATVALGEGFKRVKKFREERVLSQAVARMRRHQTPPLQNQTELDKVPALRK